MSRRLDLQEVDLEVACLMMLLRQQWLLQREEWI
jgi:hypothetical protein